MGLAPAADDRVGLSVAGLHALRESEPQAGVFADVLSQAIAVIADWERQLTPDVDRAVSFEMSLARECRHWLNDAGLVAASKTQLGLLQVLQFEPAPIQLTVDETDGTGTVTLRMYLAPYLNIRSAQDYLTVVAGVSTPRSRPAPASGLAIAHTLDYLSLVLAADHAWKGGPLISVPDLSAAGIVALDAANEAEYRRGLSAIAAILGEIQTPEIPADALGPYGGKQPGSLGRLRFWLDHRLADEAGRARALGAIKDLQQVVRLRVEGQHTGQSLRDQAVRARVHLGLPEFIYDWPDAWEIVRARVAEALETIAHEVRTAELKPY